jgi:hypothetical protein
MVSNLFSKWHPIEDALNAALDCVRLFYTHSPFHGTKAIEEFETAFRESFSGWLASNYMDGYETVPRRKNFINHLAMKVYYYHSDPVRAKTDLRTNYLGFSRNLGRAFAELLLMIEPLIWGKNEISW